MFKNALNGAAWLCSIGSACLQWLVLFVCRAVLIALGLPVVAVAVLFPVSGVSLSDGRQIVNLRRWAWLWGNDYDGLDGDKRRWWAENCDALVLFGLLPLLRRLRIPVATLDVTSWLARWWWAAVRNPVNNMRLLPYVSCPVNVCAITYLGSAVVEDSPGLGGWQFVKAKSLAGRGAWYGLYCVWQFSASRAFVFRIGFKIKPEHAGSDEPAKGMTFKLNPIKNIA